MNESLKNRIEKLQQKQVEITTIDREREEAREKFREKVFMEKMSFEKRMRAEKDEFEHSLSFLESDRVKLSNEIDCLGKDTISVKLGDLIKELSLLEGIDTSEIYTNVKTKPISFLNKHSENISESISMICSDYNTDWMLLLTGKPTLCESLSFAYVIKLNSSLNDIQADGKTLLEHCIVDVEYDMVSEKYYIVLNIKKDIDNLILNIPLKYLARSDTNEWYPADIMIQAVINCVEKSQEKEASKDNVKKRSRKLSDETKKVEVND